MIRHTTPYRGQLRVTDHSRDCAGLTYVYPVVSRRAGGVSIGINLNPNNACNWRCIYCQVPDLRRGSAPPIDLALLESELRHLITTVLQDDYMNSHVPANARRIADLAFSGNGEPTSAREFPVAVELAGLVRHDSGLDGQTRIRLITNGSLMGRSHVQEGLGRLAALGGEVWFKLDAGTSEGFHRINSVRMTPASVIRNLRRCAALCTTWVQTCLFAIDGKGPDESEIDAYIGLLARAGIERIAGVHLYGLARPSLQPEANRLSSLPGECLDDIATRLRNQGLTVLVSP